MIDLAQYYKPVRGLVWSLFPFLMWIAFLVMPGNQKKPPSKSDMVINGILGIIVLGVIGWALYEYVWKH